MMKGPIKMSTPSETGFSKTVFKNIQHNDPAAEPVLLCTLPKSRKFGRRELWLVPMGSVEGWVNNPSVRVEEDRLRDLKSRLGADIGQLQAASAIKLAGNRFRLADGHRRFAILQDSETKQFLVQVFLDVKPATDAFGELFEALNTGVRSVSKRERVWLALNGERKAAGEQACVLADELEAWLDQPSLAKFIEADCPVFAFTLAKAAVNAMAHRNIVGSFEKGEFKLSNKERHALVGRTLTWQLKCNQQQQLKLYLTIINGFGESPRKQKKMTQELLGWIVSGKPIDLTPFDVKNTVKFEEEDF